MLAEAVKYLKQLADEANPSARVFAAEGEPDHVYYVAKPDGELVRTFATVEPARHTATDIETLVSWVEGSAGTTKEIWYSRRWIEGGSAPANNQAPRCALTLTPSPQLDLLQQLELKRTGESFDQTSLIRVLRTSLADCWGGDLLGMVRKVRIDKAKQVEAEQQKGKVSLSRKDLAEMSGAADLPEEVVFDVPVFANGTIHARAGVRCALDLNPETERFVLTVIPGQIEKAFTTGEKWLESALAELIGDKNISLYFGQA
jgi:hypothetical protein